MIGSLLLAWSAQAVSLQYISQAEISADFKYQKTLVGGLSGLVFDKNESRWFTISDDRGQKAEPRIYEFKITSTNPLKIEIVDKIILKMDKKKVVDFEALSVLPWGNFLVATEGDNNRKPRVMPELFDIKRKGIFVRTYPAPEEFNPELTGQQKKGIQNNKGFEGLSASPAGDAWLVATEAPLLQEKDSSLIRLIEYRMPEAWVIKPQKQYVVALEKYQSAQELVMVHGVSEICWYQDNKLWLLERRLKATKESGISVEAKIFEVKIDPKHELSLLKKDEAPKPLEKKLLLDLSSVPELKGQLNNFEGMTLGPNLPDGRKLLLLVTDNNFLKEIPTRFVALAIKE